MNDVYLTGFGRFLPGDPIPNERVEDFIGVLGNGSDQLRDRVFEASGIKTRHFGIDEQQNALYTTAELATHSIGDALDRSELEWHDITLLTVASTVGDLLMPGIGSMVHGELGGHPCEISSHHGTCCSGVTAMKNAAMQVRAGEHNNAIACAVEYPSRMLKNSVYAPMHEKHGGIDLQAEFLRYMLADGAGAVVIQDRPAERGLSLKVEWISVRSFANENDTCMYVGRRDFSNGQKHWLDYPSLQEAAADGAFMIRQEIEMLPRLVELGTDEIERLRDEGLLDTTSLDYFVCHWASESMKQAIIAEFDRRGLDMPSIDRWWDNVEEVANIGSATIFLALEDLFVSGELKAGDTILCAIPESGRFTMGFALLTVA